MTTERLMTDEGSMRLLIAIALITIALTLSGVAFPTGLTWGFHFLGFLSPVYAVVYLAAGLLILFTVLRGGAEKVVRILAEFSSDRPWLFLTCVVVIFVVAALLFQVRASLLGDSFTLMKNIADHHEGISPLAPWSEPFSIFFLNAAASLLGPLDVAHLPGSFRIIQLILGILFIGCTYVIVRQVFSSPIHRMLTMILLISLPYMEFYFGYVETYSPSMTATAIFVLLSIGTLQERIPFYFIPPFGAVLLFLHYINGLYLPSVVFLAYREYRAGRRGNIIAGFSAMALIVFFTLTAVGFSIDRLINISPISHFLSFGGDISPVNQYSQAYGVFSIYHLGDILNYMILMSPFVLILIVVLTLRSSAAIIRRDPTTIWFIVTCVPLFAYFLVAKLEQGTANDWDAFAAHVFPSSLFAAYLFFRSGTRNATAAFTLLLLMTMLQSTLWFTINATVEPQLRRFQSLWDKRVVSQLGHYTMALRLSRYYESQGDLLTAIDPWERYTGIFPTDPRGYANAIEHINAVTPEDYVRMAGIFVRWLAVDPSNRTARHSYANACMGEGNRLFALGHLDSAQAWYETARRNDTIDAKPYNNLGGVLAEKGDLKGAIQLFQRAIALDSNYREAYYNLGRALIDSQKLEDGQRYLRKAADLGSVAARDALRDLKSPRGKGRSEVP